MLKVMKKWSPKASERIWQGRLFRDRLGNFSLGVFFPFFPNFWRHLADFVRFWGPLKIQGAPKTTPKI